MKFLNPKIALAMLIGVLIYSCRPSYQEAKGGGSVAGQYEAAQLTDAPLVPAPASYSSSQKVIVKLSI
jgi:hypothetical protein